jgi:hypothetical protein
MFASTSSPSSWLSTRRGNWSALSAPLPPQIHLQTIQQLPNNQILLRLEHMYACFVSLCGLLCYSLRIFTSPHSLHFIAPALFSCFI